LAASTPILAVVTNFTTAWQEGHKLITSKDLAVMTIRRVIFHDVPNHRKEDERELILASAETEIDGSRRSMLKKKLIKVLDSKSAYPIVFAVGLSSPVPDIVRKYSSKEQKDAAFVSSTQELAKHLHQVQHGAVSPGLLCVIDFSAASKRGLVLMKLEREAGAQLTLDHTRGQTRFAMSVLDDLVLTDGTKLFKTAAFLRTASGDDDFLMTACDSQHRVTDSSDMARFWLTYLGCLLREDPRVATSKFFNATIEFINAVVTEPVMKTQIYDSLHAELRSNKTQIVPKSFILEYVPEQLMKPYREFLEERHVSLSTFHKDVADIQTKLNRSTYLSEKGVVISAPAESEDLITVTEETIVVKDTLRSVGRR
jgi:hypothetical protein